jgi:hypothetical protein
MGSPFEAIALHAALFPVSAVRVYLLDIEQNFDLDELMALLPTDGYLIEAAA